MSVRSPTVKILCDIMYVTIHDVIVWVKLHNFVDRAQLNISLLKSLTLLLIEHSCDVCNRTPVLNLGHWCTIALRGVHIGMTGPLDHKCHVAQLSKGSQLHWS